VQYSNITNHDASVASVAMRKVFEFKIQTMAVTAIWMYRRSITKVYTLCSEKTPAHIFFHISMNDVWI